MNGDPSPRTPTPKAESRHVQALARAMNGDPPSLASLGAGPGQPEPRDQESRDPKPSNPKPETRRGVGHPKPFWFVQGIDRLNPKP